MKEFWMCLAFLSIGIVIGYVLCLQQLKHEIDNKTIEIKRAKMKNNTNSQQEFTSTLSGKPEQHKRKLSNLLKRKRNEK